MQLSKRLEMIASLVTLGNRLCDIGTDHAYLPVKLVKEGICPSALAMDVGKGPLSRAREHIRAYGLEAAIQVRLSDGFEALMPGEADTAVLAGMGGMLIIRLLEKGMDKAKALQELVLSPQSDLEAVRRFLAENGFRITHEAMCIDDGKYYTVMRAVAGQETGTERLALCYGGHLLAQKDSVLESYLKDRLSLVRQLTGQLSAVPSDKASLRLKELQDEEGLLLSALRRFNNEDNKPV